MTDRTAKKPLVQDVVGVLVFVAGAFLAFSVVMFWIDGGARDQANPTTMAVVRVIGALGPVPGFLAGLTAAGLGGLFFFAPRRVATLRHGLGALGVLVGVALLAGGLFQAGRSGGALGDVLPSLMGHSTLSGVAGAAVGAFIVAVTVWSTWIPKRARISTKLGESNPVSAALREGDASGVTSAEAAALLPVDEESEPIVPAHPIDVRLRGGVPDGASALDPSHEPSAPRESVEADRVRVATGVGARPVERAGADLAAPPAASVAPAAEPLVAEPGADPRGAPGAGLAAKPDAPAGSGDPTVRVLNFGRGGSAEDTVVRPSWEQSGDDDEAVTEASVQALEPVAGDAAAAPVETAPELPWEHEAEPEADDTPAADARAIATPEVEDESDVDDEEEWDDDELESELADYDAEEEDEEEDEEQDAEAELEEDEDAEDEEDEDEDEDDEEYAESDDEEAEDDEDEVEYVYVDENGEEIEPEDEGEESILAAELEEDQDDAATEVASDEEPEVVVDPAPRAAPKPARGSRSASKRSGRKAGGSADHEERVREAGLMIIERDRVAVSLIQREFELDFKEATALLDELQDRGLIGPYLGGRHRDILLSREAWLAKVTTS